MSPCNVFSRQDVLSCVLVVRDNIFIVHSLISLTRITYVIQTPTLKYQHSNTNTGTSWHAGIVGEYLLEHLAGISVEVEYASEFRYKKPVLFKDEDVVLVISQSGETADTLAAVR